MFSGLMFLTIGGVFVTGRVDVTDLESQWLWPLPLILGGLLIFAAAFRGEPKTAADEPAEDEPAEDEPAHEAADEAAEPAADEAGEDEDAEQMIESD
jgi:hypothetical protein